MKNRSVYLEKIRKNLGHKFLVGILCSFFMACSVITWAGPLQSSTLSGLVVDPNDEPLIGVTVMLKGTTIGTVTDIDGNFTLKLSGKNPVVQCSYIGYETQEIQIKKQRHIKVVMQEEQKLLDEVVVVAYGTQSKVSVTGAVSSIKTAEIKQAPSANLVSSLTGRLPGLTTIQSSGLPGDERIDMFLRGASTTNNQNPLILIDGVPRDNIMSIDPNEVESISVLKDASSTAVFGVRGANGVILITTKQGSQEKPSLSISAEFGRQQATRELHMVDSWEYATLRNQAFINNGMAAPFSERQIQLFRSGTSPLYPNNDWWDMNVKSSSPQNRYNVNLSGGNERIKYFVNMGMLNQGGPFKTQSKKSLGYNPEFSLNRYNFRTNINIKINNWIKTGMNLAAYIDKQNKAGVFDRGHRGDITLIYASFYQANNNLIGPVTTPELAEKYGIIPGIPLVQYDVTNGNSPYTTTNGRGFENQDRSTLNSSFFIDFDLGWITQGLTTKVMASFDTKSQSNRSGRKSENSYRYSVKEEVGPNGEVIDVPRFTPSAPIKFNPISFSRSSSSQYTLNLQWMINYSRLFASKHQVTGMFLMQRDNSEASGGNSDMLLPYNVLGFSGRLGYRYDDRYMFEFNAGYNGSEQFAPGNRFGFFPAASLGWVVSNEKFMKRFPTISNLKLRASYGKVGNDKLGNARFLYLDNYSIAGGGFSPSLGHGQLVDQTMVANPNISWEIAYKQNYGFDLELFNHSFKLNVDYYREKREDILITQRARPSLLGLPTKVVPKANLGKINNQGFEIEASYNKKINKDWNIFVKGTFNYNRNKIIEMDEVPMIDNQRPYASPYRQEGYSIGQNFGYQIDWNSKGHGYFTSKEEIKNSGLTYVGVAPRPGDFVYKDQNGDKIIDNRDEVPIGYGRIPRINYSAMLNVSWKGLDFSCMFQGVSKTSQFYKDWGIYEYYSLGTFFKIHRNAWTPERYESGAKITYPALSTTASASHKNNDFFIMDRSFVRLKNAEIGYTLPKSLTRKIKIENLRLYLNGQNLLTWDKLPFDHFDPEQRGTTVIPINRVFNFGANITF